MSLSQSPFQSHEPNPEVALKLKQERQLDAELRSKQTAELYAELHPFLSLSQIEKHPENPFAIKGSEGIKASNDLLKERGNIGILIGGLASIVWDDKVTEEDLNSHKDVDVMTLDLDRSNRSELIHLKENPFRPKKKFEGGIDWWIPTFTAELHHPKGRTQEMSIEMGDTIYQGIEWSNGNGIRLNFSAHLNNLYSRKSGLYLLTPEAFLEMKKAEIVENINNPEKFMKYATKEILQKQNSFIKDDNLESVINQWLEETFKFNPMVRYDYKSDYHFRYRSLCSPLRQRENLSEFCSGIIEARDISFEPQYLMNEQVNSGMVTFADFNK